MALIEWKEIYSVGNSTIDRQHQQLFSIANRYHAAYTRREDRAILKTIFEELIAYTAFHFKEEERLMQEGGFPDFLAHKQSHEKLVKVVLQYKDNFDDGPHGIEEQAMQFIKTWLNGHILGMDRKYKPYLADKGVDITAHIAPTTGTEIPNRGVTGRKR